jgi:hypothetical protein
MCVRPLIRWHVQLHCMLASGSKTMDLCPPDLTIDRVLALAAGTIYVRRSNEGQAQCGF